MEGKRGRNPPNSSICRVRNRASENLHEDIPVHPFPDPHQQRQAEGFVLTLHLLRFVTLKLRGRLGTRACARILLAAGRVEFHRDSRLCR